MIGFGRAKRAGAALTVAGLMTLTLGVFATQASAATSSIKLNPACHGAFTPGQLKSLSKSITVVESPEGFMTVDFKITYPQDTSRKGGRLLDCIMVGGDKSGLIASIQDTSDLNSGIFTGSYTVAVTGTFPEAQIHIDYGQTICDVAFLTGNDTGNVQGAGQKTPAPICTPVLFPATTTTTAPTTTTTTAPTTTTTEATTTTVPETTTTLPEETTTTVPETTTTLPEETTTTVPETTTTEATTTTLPEATTTTIKPIVLGKQITTTTVPAAPAPAPIVLGKTITQPAAGSLPFTGSNPAGFIALAGLLMLSGGGLLLAGRKSQA